MDWKQEYIEATQPHPLLSFMRIWTDGPDRWVAFEIPLHWERDCIHLGCIQNLTPGDGAGSAALDWLLDLADRHGKPVEGGIMRLGTKGLTLRELRRWYRRHGFAISRHGSLRYTPGSRAPGSRAPEENIWWRNYYECPECSATWEDCWECQVDDDCPQCGTRHISPFDSAEVCREPAQ